MLVRLFAVSAWLAILWTVVLARHPVQLWQGVGLAGLAAVGLFLAQAHLSSVRCAHAVGLLRRPWWGHRLFEGHWLRVALALVVSGAFGMTVAADVATRGATAMVWVSAAALAGFAGSEGLFPVLGNYRPFARRSRAMLAGAVAAGLVVGLAWTLVERPEADLTAQPVYDGPSLALAWIVEIAAYKAWGLGRLFEELPPVLAGVLRVVSAAGFFGLVAHAAAGASLLFSAEGRRVLTVSGEDVPPRVPALRTAVAMAAAVVVAAATLRVAATGERALMTLPSLPELLVAEWRAPELPGDGIDPPATAAPPPETPEARVLAMVARRERVQKDMIGALVCEAGAGATLQAANAGIAAALEEARVRARSGVRSLFDGARARVPEYLDWYFSLDAEYLRIGALLSGSASEHLVAQTSVWLTPEVLDRTEAVFADLRAAQGAYQSSRASAVITCQAEPALPSDAVETVTVRWTKLDTGISDSAHASYIMSERLSNRIEAAAGAAAVGVLVTGYVMVSGSGKAALKTVAKAAAKRSTGLLGGILGGGAAGGGVGSVIPGAGTAVGAIVGGIAGGVVVFVGVDYLTLKLDEFVSRDALEADVMAAIDAAEAKVLADLGL
jgi:hypothetical protein